MPESYQQNASIEGRGMALKTRKFFPVLPTRGKNGVLKYGFKLGMNSHAELTKAYDEPESCVAYSTSMVCVGDSIKGTVISGWCAKPHAKPYVSKGSGSHSATFIDVQSDCFAMLNQGVREHYNNEETAKKNPPLVMIQRIEILDAGE